MKKYRLILILMLLITTLGCKAQIVPIEEQRDYRGEETGYPDGTDFLDVNNVFDTYVGVWTGSYSLEL